MTSLDDENIGEPTDVLPTAQAGLMDEATTSIYRVPITKAGQFLEIDTSRLSHDVYVQIVQAGLKAFANARMSKVGSVTKMAGDELAKAQAAAMKIAAENRDKLYSGDLRVRSTKATKAGVPREVMTEARRLALHTVNNQIRAQGMKVGLVSRTLKTQLVEKLLLDDPSYFQEAIESLENIKTKPSKTSLVGLFAHDPNLVNKAAKKSDERRVHTLSAKQAGLASKRVPPARPKGLSH